MPDTRSRKENGCIIMIKTIPQPPEVSRPIYFTRNTITKNLPLTLIPKPKSTSPYPENSICLTMNGITNQDSRNFDIRFLRNATNPSYTILSFGAQVFIDRNKFHSYYRDIYFSQAASCFDIDELEEAVLVIKYAQGILKFIKG